VLSEILFDQYRQNTHTDEAGIISDTTFNSQVYKRLIYIVDNPTVKQLLKNTDRDLDRLGASLITCPRSRDSFLKTLHEITDDEASLICSLPKVEKARVVAEKARAVAAAKEFEKARVTAYNSFLNIEQPSVPKATAAAKEAFWLEAAARVDVEKARAVAAAKEVKKAVVVAAAKVAKEVEKSRLVAAAKEAKEVEKARVVAAAKEAKEVEKARVVAAAKEVEKARVVAAAKEVEKARVVAAAKEVEKARVVAAAKEAKEVEKSRVVAAAKEVEKARVVAAAKEVEKARVVAAAVVEVENARAAAVVEVEKARAALAEKSDGYVLAMEMTGVTTRVERMYEFLQTNAFEVGTEWEIKFRRTYKQCMEDEIEEIFRRMEQQCAFKN
jgi:hypothetical protein